ncbi:DUF1878 family protein [Clostridium sp. FP2]|uniref:DUF1878 family protein n=1 Tax=Clostridium sp. FP2 TaxID=2724481 RepID=UPI0013E99678|nr:DUF1878 family protein [Clostridium sp. FP2]MBZ9626017.1 DUF1878 family protein [Clostridium sp. FP2]
MHENNLFKESPEEKVERIEYYINLMRDYVLDTEKFQFWDWAMSKRLNEFEVRKIIDITKIYNNKLYEEKTPDFEEYCSKIKNILNWANRPDYKEPVNESFIISMLGCLKKLMFRNLIDFFLTEPVNANSETL